MFAGRIDRGVFCLYRVAVLAFLMLPARRAAGRLVVHDPLPDVLAGRIDRRVFSLYRVAVFALLMLFARRAAGRLVVHDPLPNVFAGGRDRSGRFIDKLAADRAVIRQFFLARAAAAGGSEHRFHGGARLMVCAFIAVRVHRFRDPRFELKSGPHASADAIDVGDVATAVVVDIRSGGGAGPRRAQPPTRVLVKWQNMYTLTLRIIRSLCAPRGISSCVGTESVSRIQRFAVRQQKDLIGRGRAVVL